MDGEVVVEDAPDRRLERFVPLGAFRQPIWFAPPGGMVMVSGIGLQDAIRSGLLSAIGKTLQIGSTPCASR